MHDICKDCSLKGGCRHPCIQPDTNFNSDEEYADVLICGEAPGADEDRVGKPFVGRSGQLLRSVVREVGLDFYNIAYTNIVHCHPPNNKTPSLKQIKRCLPMLKEEIEYYQPALLILLGNTPLKAVLGESGITNWRGVLVEREAHAIMPTLHPAYILRNNTALETWVGDFEKAYALLTGEGDTVGNVSDGYEKAIVTDVPGVLAMLDVIYEDGICAWDTEVNGLRYGDKLVCMSFACREAKQAWCVTVEHDAVVKYLADLLTNPEIGKVGHNIKFDWLAVHGNWHIEVQGIVGDSMLLSGVIDPVRGRHGLKNLAGRYLGMYDYDAEFVQYLAEHREANPKYAGDLELVPIKILADYAILDAIATIELHAKLLGDVTPEQRILYDELIVPASDALAKMESNGILLDDDIVLEYLEIYEAKQDELLKAIRDNATVKKLQRAVKDKKFVFNPNSSVQMRKILFGSKYFGLEPVGRTKTGQPSTAWANIKVYARDLPFLQDYRYYKLLGKMLSTYLRPPRDKWKDSDGRVRSNYNLMGTETGRLASSNPNLQNIPTPEKEPGTLLETYPIKNIFTHTWKLCENAEYSTWDVVNTQTGEILDVYDKPSTDGCILAVDYSGMELRTMASISNCAGMRQAFEQGIDVHSYVTALLFKVNREDYTDEAWKPMRYRAKWVNWTLLFGGSAYTLQNLYGIPMEEAEQLVATYYEAFPEVLEYKEKTLEFARDYGYVESKFGRRRYLPYINDFRDRSRQAHDERAAINMPIQSAASDILVCSLIILRDQLVQNNYRSMMINTVHDSVMLDIFPGELEDVAWLCHEVLEGITTKYGPEYFPGLDFSWFTVPLKVDIEYGGHYGSLQRYVVEGKNEIR